MGGSSGNIVVLQVLPSLVTGGVERGTIEMTQAIAEAGWSPLVASAGGRLVPAVEHAGGRHISLPLASRNPMTIWRNAARLASVIRAERVSIVHARSRAPAWSCLLACRQTGTHFVTTYHGTYNEDLPFKRRYNSVMAKGERVIVASRFIADLIARQHQTDPARIRVIPRGVDPALFDPGAVAGHRLARLAQAWQLPHGASHRAAAWAADELEGAGGADRGTRTPRPARHLLCAGRLGPGPASLFRQSDPTGRDPRHCRPAASGRRVRRYAGGADARRRRGARLHASPRRSAGW